MCIHNLFTTLSRDWAWTSLYSIATAILILTGCTFALLPSESLAAVYKCEDQGKVTYSGTKCSGNVQVLSSKNDEPVEQHGTLTLYLNAERNYSVQGSINDHPVVFVVDTGATTTTISKRTAEAAGIKYCAGYGYTSTANGLVSSCVVTVPKISFGMFHLNNVTVSILPDLNVDGLLGMNVLRQMKIRQQNDAMYISN